MVSRMIFHQRFFEHLCFYVVVLLLLPCKELVPVAISIVAGDGTTKIGCMENEGEALLKFKQGVVDDYGILSSWGREADKKDCCNWGGVTCSNYTGHIITLDLQGKPYQNLRGKISPSLHELQHLTYLDLSDNEFSGSIPHQLGNLTNLQVLSLGGYHLSVNNLEWLSDLRSLEKLYLNSVDLGMFDWLQSIDKLSFLSELSLVSCELPGIISPPIQLTNLSSIPLTKIDLSSNNFTSSSVFNWLFNFSSNVVDISMSGNPLGGSIPDAFGNMASLESLSLSNCALEGVIPKSFKNLSRLTSLDLSRNNLTENLPELLQALIASETSLVVLDLSRNKIYGSLLDFTRFSSLSQLWLGSNKLTGSFPTSFGQSSSLEYLDFSQNELNGSFPDLTSFPSLQELYLHNNKLKGRLPESIGQLSNLKVLYLSFNLLTLEFSANWTPHFQLDYIALDNCKLGPQFPEWLRSQNSFAMLHISHVGISDTIPHWFWDLSPRLLYLNMSYNQIHGMLPDLSVKFIRRSTIDIRFNHFQGPIPMLPPNMTILNLSKNMFSGSIISLCTIATKFLSFLDLSDNLLSGEVPDCWIHAKELQILDFGINNFSGKIPASFGFLHQLQSLSLHNNNFTGELPSSLKNCTSLKIIDVSENKLSGQVPSWIGTQLASLVVFSFRRNEFYGSIPHSICNLSSTQVLDLSQNKITGNIPECFNKFNALTQTNGSSVAMSFEFEGVFNKYGDGLLGYYVREYVAGAWVQWKGKVSEYRSTLGLLKCIDLSSNKIVGNIPQELASLEGLISLNLSRNHLTGNMMQNVRQMKMLEILDLSRNLLSGEIPTGLASLTLLSVLDLSSNNFSGKIPSSTQLQSFNASTYAGNQELCGLPLPNKCPEDELAPVPPSTDHGKGYTNEEDEDKFLTIGFFVSVILGFTIGFWAFFGSLLLRSSWRYAYFTFLDKIKDWIFVIVAVSMRRLHWKLRG